MSQKCSTREPKFLSIDANVAPYDARVLELCTVCNAEHPVEWCIFLQGPVPLLSFHLCSENVCTANGRPEGEVQHASRVQNVQLVRRAYVHHVLLLLHVRYDFWNDSGRSLCMIKDFWPLYKCESFTHACSFSKWMVNLFRYTDSHGRICTRTLHVYLYIRTNRKQLPAARIRGTLSLATIGDVIGFSPSPEACAPNPELAS